MIGIARLFVAGTAAAVGAKFGIEVVYPYVCRKAKELHEAWEEAKHEAEAEMHDEPPVHPTDNGPPYHNM